MARTRCSACHAYPAPSQLDRETWIDHVLPQMGARLGIWTFREQVYGIDADTPDGVYATSPMLDQAAWDKIVSFYEMTAPEGLMLPDTLPHSRLDLFDIEMPDARSEFPTSTAILIDETAHRLLLGDSYELDLEIYDRDLVKLDQIRSGGAISRIRSLASDGYLVTTMGGNIGQAEQPFGLLLEIDADISGVTRLARELHRPVNMLVGDYNADGIDDYIIAEFGTHSGKLSLHLSQPDGSRVEKVLLGDAGVTSIIRDRDDLLVLIAQGYERIVRLRGFVRDAMEVETLLRFPPSQGSSSLSAADFNDDGVIDLLYTAGDNADISPIYKPYHGVYVYHGQPDGTFAQDMFFHLDGATSAVAVDFDLDGDLDIATIAYYLNSSRDLDEASFVYLENSDTGYSAKTIEGIGRLGRFVAMSAGDIDGDGDSDIALSNMAFGPYGPLEISSELQHEWLDGSPFVLLRNQLVSGN